ncbi:hypothetical protein ACO34A_09875 [Rhizobium sp. ACO-34A]|nr:hypothetical protein [Rhizobium sp. ACO-34A]ATN34113.1 hypothetical protein ACO34A_09875 [Rhizobium sp. ACO-34A]
MTDKVKIRRAVDTAAERDDAVTAAELYRSVGTDPVYHPETSLTLTPKHQGRLLVFTSACTITVPADLPRDFSCGWAQAGTGVLTFQAGPGVNLRSFGGALTSSGQYSLGGVAGMPDGDLWLYGALE